MALPTTPAELLEIMRARFGLKEDNIEDRKEYRYVVYARKSTDSTEKQIRSLGDQISECEEFSAKQELDVKDIIQESESAKEPDIRPKFRKMIEDVKAGKYDGIIAWHPDRLARNMKDAGEIIDLLDKGVIKDLKFASFSFSNDTAGKMLLGITFVLSKEYSDKLSDDISRGIGKSIEAGSYVNKAKHGYYKDPLKRLQPDGDNFLLIKEAFGMRVSGKTLEEIATYLNDHGYKRVNGDGTRSLYKMNFRRVENFMRDPVYTGALMYGKKGGVDLTQVYEFQSAISVPNFMRINKLAKDADFMRLARKYRKGEEVKANLMRGMIICAECKEVMGAGITTKKNSKKGTTKYLYYRCTTTDCPKKNKSVRAKVISEYINKFLATKPFSSKEAYAHYAKEMELVSARRVREAQNLLISSKTQKNNLENKLVKLRGVLADETDEEIKGPYRKDIKKAQNDAKELTKKIEDLEKSLKSLRSTTLTYEEFLELMDKMAETIASIASMKDLDAIIKKVFSNFFVRGNSVEKSTLNEPFQALYELNVSKCGDGGN